MNESMYVRNLNEKQAEELLDITKNIRMKSKVQQSEVVLVYQHVKWV